VEQSERNSPISNFRNWTDGEADDVISFIEKTNPNLLRRIEVQEGTTRDLSGNEGLELGRILAELHPNVSGHDRTRLLVAVRLRIQSKLTS